MRHDLARIRNAEIIARVAGGSHVRDLAKEYGLVPQYIAVMARKAGVKVDGKREKQERVMKRHAVVSELHALGISGGQAIALLGVARPTFYKDARDLGLKFPYDTTNCAGPHGAEVGQRADKMAAMYRAGMTLQQIGEKYGISRERVRQVMTRHLGIVHKDGGQTKRAASRRAQRAAQRDAEYLASHGCTRAQYKEVREIGRRMVADGVGIYRTPLRAFISQQNNAKIRGIGWGLTFWQWWTFWQESGKWEMRGRGKDLFVMSRHRDEGPYAIGNVYIGTLSENSSDQPNNPYRLDHPDHKRAWQDRKERGVDHPRRRMDQHHVHVGLPKGVTRNRSSFVAQVSIGGRSKHLGSFKTAEAAHAAYLDAISSPTKIGAAAA